MSVGVLAFIATDATSIAKLMARSGLTAANSLKASAASPIARKREEGEAFVPQECAGKRIMRAQMKRRLRIFDCRLTAALPTNSLQRGVIGRKEIGLRTSASSPSAMALPRRAKTKNKAPRIVGEVVVRIDRQEPARSDRPPCEGRVRDCRSRNL